MYKVFLINSMKKSGGTERVVANLSNEWSKKDKIEIIVTDDSNLSFYHLSTNIRIVSLNIKPYDKNPISVFLWLYNIIRKVASYLKKINQIIY